MKENSDKIIILIIKERKIINKIGGLKLKRNFKLNEEYILILIFIIFFIPIFLSKQIEYKKRNLHFVSEIIITIKGKGDQSILSEASITDDKVYSFDYEPDQIFINGELQSYVGKKVYNLINEENEITMRFYSEIYNCNLMFYCLYNITKIDFSNFDSSKVTEALGMFYRLSSLTSLNLNNFNTSLINNMNYMFYSCKILISLDLSNFDTKNVKLMSSMFFDCEKLQSLNIKSFNTSLVTDMSYIFYYCNSLTSLDLNHFNTSLVNDMSNMFSNCNSLKSLYINKFNTSLVTNMNYMFYNCRSLIYLDLNNLDTLKVKNMNSLFRDCISLISLNINNFNTTSVTEMNSMFSNCYSLKSLNLNNFDTSLVTNMENMFFNCFSLKSLDIKNFNTSSVNKMNGIFYNCSSLISLDLSNFDTSFITEINDMFFKISNFTKYCIDEYKTPNIISQIKSLNKSYINNCLDICFSKNKKLIIEKNICVSNCINEDFYKYEYNDICYETCPDKTYLLKSNYLCEQLNFEDLFNNKYVINNPSVLIKDAIINNMREDIINGKINISNIIKGEKKDLLLKNKDTIYQITSTDNQNNKEYYNLSTIHLGDCEDILKKEYNIDNNLPIIILKIEQFIPGALIPVIGYELFNPINKEKLDINYCKNKVINYSIPVSIDEDNLFLYDPNSDFYTDDCVPYTTENGTDILLNDRHEEFNEKNRSICENKCDFLEYNISSKKSICNCEIKTNQFIISEIINDTNIFTKNFTNKDLKTNLISMKCYNTLFSKDGLLENIGNYILVIITIIFMILGIIFYKFGFPLLTEDIEEIISLKNKTKEKKKRNKKIIYRDNNKEIKFIKKKNKKRMTNAPKKKIKNN